MEALFSSLVLVAVWIGLVIGAVVSVIGLCLLLDERKRSPQVLGAGSGSGGTGKITHANAAAPAPAAAMAVAQSSTGNLASGGAAHPAGALEHGHGDHPAVPYFLIFGALGIMTIITIAVSFVNLGKAGNVALAMFVASIKATLVMLFFMHLKYERKTLVLIALAPFALAAVLFFALFPDIVFGQYHTHDYSAEAAQTEKKH